MADEDAADPELLTAVLNEGGWVEPERHRIEEGLSVAWMRLA